MVNTRCGSEHHLYIYIYTTHIMWLFIVLGYDINDWVIFDIDQIQQVSCHILHVCDWRMWLIGVEPTCQVRADVVAKKIFILIMYPWEVERFRETQTFKDACELWFRSLIGSGRCTLGTRDPRSECPECADYDHKTPYRLIPWPLWPMS